MGKSNRKSSGKHVQLPEWLQQQPAWRTMKPGPRALYIELKRLYCGRSAVVKLSHKDAGDLLNVGRDTVAGYFKDLIERGFVVIAEGHHLGAEGKGVPNKYRLTEVAHEGQKPTKDFTKWRPAENLKPPLENPTPPVGKSNTPCRKTRHSGNQMSENPATFEEKSGKDVGKPDNIYNIPYASDELSASDPPPRRTWGNGCATVIELRKRLDAGLGREGINSQSSASGTDQDTPIPLFLSRRGGGMNGC